MLGSTNGPPARQSRSRSPAERPRCSRSKSPAPSRGLGDRHRAPGRSISVQNRSRRSRSPPQAHPSRSHSTANRVKPSATQDFVLENWPLSSLERAELRSSSAPRELFYVGTHHEVKAKTSQTVTSDGQFVIRHADQIGYRYELSEQLGRGTFGLVVKAYDHKYSDLPAVAVKVVNLPKLTAQAPRRLDEVEILFGHLWNPTPEASALVRVLTHGVFRGHQWISMELLGPSVFVYLKEGKRFLPKELLTAARDLFQGLQFIHSRKVIHQDLNLTG